MMWVTLMGFVGAVALTLFCAGPAARRLGSQTLVLVTTRLARLALPVGVLALPALLTVLARDASEGVGYDYGAAWHSLYDGTNAGRLAGLEFTLTAVAVVLIAPLAMPVGARSRVSTWLLGAGLLSGTVALGSTKFPAKAPDDWGRTSFATGMWMLHLIGGAVWIGGLLGLLALVIPRGVGARRGEFWSRVIRRFSAVAMSCVAAIGLSGLFLYWEHVDGPSQLLTTMYGRVLGVKVVIFSGLLLLGAVNQFWLHPRIEASRRAGDDRPLRTILARDFPLVVAVELVLGLSVLFVAPFLHGSARNQAYQAAAAEHAGPAQPTPAKIAPKQVSASTWVWGTAETVVVVAVMAVGYCASGRIARSRASRTGDQIAEVVRERATSAS